MDASVGQPATHLPRERESDKRIKRECNKSQLQMTGGEGGYPS